MSLTGAVLVIFASYSAQDELQVALLHLEVADFKQRYQNDPNARLPDSASIAGYVGLQDVPDTYRPLVQDLESGVFQLKQDILSELADEREIRVIVEPLGEGQPSLYFISDIPDAEADRSAETNLLYLLAIYLAINGLFGTWWASFVSRKISRPLELMTEEIRSANTDDPKTNLSAIYGDGEIGIFARTLDDKNRRITEFIQRERNVMRNVSHELRTPITVLRSSLSIVKEGPLDRSTYTVDRNMMEKVERAARDLEAMIEAFLWLGREQDKCEEPTDCSACVERAIADHAYLAEAKQLELRIDVDRRVILPCKEQIFYIAVANLVRNAFNHANAGVVSIRLSGGTFEVRNDDPGLDQRTLAHLTKPNVKGDLSDGFGLGLHIVQQICDRMSWTLKIALNSNVDSVTASIAFY